jgi:hypothetical protein
MHDLWWYNDVPYARQHPLMRNQMMIYNVELTAKYDSSRSRTISIEAPDEETMWDILRGQLKTDHPFYLGTTLGDWYWDQGDDEEEDESLEDAGEEEEDEEEEDDEIPDEEYEPDWPIGSCRIFLLSYEPAMIDEYWMYYDGESPTLQSQPCSIIITPDDEDDELYLYYHYPNYPVDPALVNEIIQSIRSGPNTEFDLFDALRDYFMPRPEE